MNRAAVLQSTPTIELFQQACQLLSATPQQTARPRRRLTGRRSQPSVAASEPFTNEEQLRTEYAHLLRMADASPKATAAELAFRDKLIQMIEAAS